MASSGLPIASHSPISSINMSIHQRDSSDTISRPVSPYAGSELRNRSSVSLPEQQHFITQEAHGIEAGFVADQERDVSDPDPIETSDQEAKSLRQDKSHRRPRMTRRIDHFANEWWLLEVTSCGGAVLSLLAIAIFLKVYDGHPQPQWPHGITPNSVISWFATLLRAFILMPIAACIGQASWNHFHDKSHPLKDIVVFDEASRGAVGSAFLMIKFWQRLFACVGAMITILSIGINPIVQQLVSIQARTIDGGVGAGAGASLGRAQSFVQYDTLPTDTEDTSPLFLPTPEMIGAMYEGMFFRAGSSSASTLEMTPSCPTGNCTFPVFQSLAVGSACENVTHLLKSSCGGQGRYCEHSLPNGLKVNRTSEDTSPAMASSGYLGPANAMLYGNSFFNFSIINTTDAFASNLTDGLTAMQCFLYWSMNTYNSTVRGGQLQETVHSTWHSNTTLWTDNDGHDLDLTDGLSDSIKTDLHPPSAPNQNFTIGYISSQSLSQWLAAALTISNSLAVRFDDLDEAGFSPDTSSNDTASIPILQTIRNFQQTPSLSTLFGNTAKAITRNLRDQSWTAQTVPLDFPLLSDVSGVGDVNGTATSLEVYIAVKWIWMVFPCVLVLATIVFLGSTVVWTKVVGLPAWKASPLPFLFHGIGTEVGEQGNAREEREVWSEARGLTDMKVLAGRYEVQLKDEKENGCGLALR